MNKHCTGCNRDLPATSEYFHKKNTKSGFASRCKECIKAYYNRYYTENHERVKNSKNEMGKVYYEKNSNEINSRKRKQYKEGTSVKKSYMDNYYKVNRQDILVKYKEFRRTEHGKAQRIIYNQRRRSREESVEADFSNSDWIKCKEYFNNQCAYCGESKTLTREHFIPLVDGGEYTINNIIPACKSCNSSKKNSDFFIWYPKREYYSKEREQKILSYLNYNENNMQQLALL